MFENLWQIATPFLLIVILGLLLLQIRFTNKFENNSGREYLINNYVVLICNVFFITVLGYFSYKFGTEIANLLAKPTIWIY